MAWRGVCGGSGGESWCGYDCGDAGVVAGVTEPDMTSTAVQVYDELFGWRWVTVIHRADLSDLGEPYLSLVKKHREQWTPARYWSREC